MNQLTEKSTEVRNSVDKLIKELADEAIKTFDTYEEAVKEVKQLKWKMVGTISDFILEEVRSEIVRKALRKKTAE